MEKIQCPVCIHKPEAAHAWYGSTARVKRKWHTRETETPHAWNGSGARVIRTTVAAPGYGSFPVIGICKQPTQQSIRWERETSMNCNQLGFTVQSTWFYSTINLISPPDQLVFLREYALKASRFQHAFNLLCSRLLWWKEGIISSFTRIHHLSPQASYIQCFMVKLHQRDSL